MGAADLYVRRCIADVLPMIQTPWLISRFGLAQIYQTWGKSTFYPGMWLVSNKSAAPLLSGCLSATGVYPLEEL